ncbi:MAG TPA: hypothetical protein VJA27_03235, partial [Patescibacteria group bacterium]|nr:hypothetical protein [Patescibacteria group bacterium]
LTIRRGGGINLGIALNGVLQYQAVGHREREVAIGGMVELEFAGDLKNIKEKIKAMFQKRN